MYKRLAQDLVKIFNEQAYLSICLDNSIKELNLNINDKKVYTKVIYGVCENRLLIDYNLSSLIKGKRVKPFIKNILRIGVYVIDYMNMKDHFIVNELVKIVKKDDYKSAMFVNGVLRNYQRSEKPSVYNLKNIEKISLKLSLPLDLTNLLYKQYKESMIEFFFGLPEEIKVQMFGNIKLEQFTKQGNLRAPEFGKAVTHEKVRETIQKAKATVIIGDPKYIELDDIAERFYESIIYGQVTFVDEKYDKTNRAYNNPNLKKFLRVKNRTDLVYKLKAIKNDKQLFEDIVKLQVEDLYNNFDKNVFCSDLVKLIGSLE